MLERACDALHVLAVAIGLYEHLDHRVRDFLVRAHHLFGERLRATLAHVDQHLGETFELPLVVEELADVFEDRPAEGLHEGEDGVGSREMACFFQELSDESHGLFVREGRRDLSHLRALFGRQRRVRIHAHFGEQVRGVFEVEILDERERHVAHHAGCVVERVLVVATGDVLDDDIDEVVDGEVRLF